LKYSGYKVYLILNLYIRKNIMAYFIETDEVRGETIPSTAGSIIRKEQYGIDAILSGYIIQNVSISKSRVTDDTYDQKNSLVSQLDVDERWDG
jgi:hypothetical protein